jgi:hypothetical protein
VSLTAKLFPVWTPDLGAAGMPYSDRYNVTFGGEIVVKSSRDPECHLARALLARGHTGTVTMLDGATGKPRTIIDIEKAAKLYAKEGPLRFAPHESRPERPPAGETESGGIEVPKDTHLVVVIDGDGNW